MYSLGFFNYLFLFSLPWLKTGKGQAVRLICLCSLGKRGSQDSTTHGEKEIQNNTEFAHLPCFCGHLTASFSQIQFYREEISLTITHATSICWRFCTVCRNAVITLQQGQIHSTPCSRSFLEMDSCCDIFSSCYNFCHCNEVTGIVLSHFHIAMPYSVDLFNIQYFEWLTIALLLFLLKGEPNLLQRAGVTSQLKWKILKRSD